MKPFSILLAAFWVSLFVTAEEQKAMVVTPTPEQVADAPPPAPPPVAETAIPEAFPQARYESSWQKNPFLLKTAPVIQVQESWAKDFVLTALAEIGGVFRVSIRNKVTGESKRIVQGQEGDSEYKVVSVNLQPNRKESSVELSKGAETATLKYDETQLVAQARPNTAGAQPGARVGVPVSGTQNLPGGPGGPGGASGRQIGAAGAMGTNRSAPVGAIPGRMSGPNMVGGGGALAGGTGYNTNLNANGGLPNSVPSVRNTYAGPQTVNSVAGATPNPNNVGQSSVALPAAAPGVNAAGVNMGTASSSVSFGVPAPLPGSTVPNSNTAPTTPDPLAPNATSPVIRRRSLIPAPGNSP